MTDTPTFDRISGLPIQGSLDLRTSAGEELVDGRISVYGDPTETFARIAQVWSGITGLTINATDVPLMMAGMKLVRAQVTPDYSDNSDDVEGYIDIFRKVVGPDMVKARSVDEYLLLKGDR